MEHLFGYSVSLRTQKSFLEEDILPFVCSHAITGRPVHLFLHRPALLLYLLRPTCLVPQLFAPNSSSISFLLIRIISFGLAWWRERRTGRVTSSLHALLPFEATVGCLWIWSQNPRPALGSFLQTLLALEQWASTSLVGVKDRRPAAAAAPQSVSTERGAFSRPPLRTFGCTLKMYFIYIFIS